MFLIPKCQNYIFINAHISFFFFIPLHSSDSSVPLPYEDSHPDFPHSYPQFPAFPPLFTAFPLRLLAFLPWFPCIPIIPTLISHIPIIPTLISRHSFHSPHSVSQFPTPAFTDSPHATKKKFTLVQLKLHSSCYTQTTKDHLIF